MANRKEKIAIYNPYARKKRKRSTNEDHEYRSSSTLFGQSTSPKSLSTDQASHEPNPDSKSNTFDSGVSAQASALIISAADKAGMEGIDRSKIDAIILRESGNSLYMQQQRRRDEKVNQRVRQLQQRLQDASPRDYRETEELDEMLRSYQKQQATRATCVVVDMDMFYMACELLSRPDLNDKPACVGRGMILTSNYVARRYGVRSAMAGFIGDKLVEELSKGRERLIHVRSNFDLYKEKSRIVTEVIREYDPHNMKSYSLDEVYLDIGPYLALFIQHRDYSHEQIRDLLREDSDTDESGNKSKYLSCTDSAMGYLQSQSPLVCLNAVDQVILRLRRHVQKTTGGLTCSAGVARTHTIAKIASDKNKPNGQLVVDPANTVHFVRQLPVRKIPGVGRVTEKLLQNVCNVHTGMDLYQKRGLVHFLFQPATAKFLLKASVGCSGEGSASTFGMDGEEESASSSECQKGISKERTFQPESDWAQLNIRLEEIARSLAKDMMRKSVMGHTVTVKVKLETFDVLSRSQSQKRGVYVQNPEEVATIASGLFAEIRAAHLKKENKNGRNRFSVRLLGIRCSNLVEESSFCGKQHEGAIDKFFTSSSATAGSKEASPQRNLSPGRNLAIAETGNSEARIYSKREGKPGNPTFNFDAPSQNSGHSPSAKSNGDRHGSWTTDSTNTVTNNRSVCHVICQNDNNKKVIDTKPTQHTATPVEDMSPVKEQHHGFVQCPLCQRSFLARDNDRLNAHVDTCLNGIYGGSTVRRVIQEEESRLKNSPSAVESIKSSLPGRRQRLTDFWN